MFFCLEVIKKNKNQNYINEALEQEAIIVALDTQKEEEIKKQQELKKEQEKNEEENANGVIYLTFDDGPTVTTSNILSILEKKNIKATFFVLHYTDKYEDTIKREYKAGHTVALHGYTHTYSEVYNSIDNCMNNFYKIQEQVKQTTGQTSNIIRFIGGSSNSISKKYCSGIMTDATQRVINEGFRYFDWNVDSDDAGKAKTSDDVYYNVINGIQKYKRSVVLMHDFAGNEKTVAALERIIDYGLENGYVFRGITEDTQMVTHGVNN